MPYPAAPPLVPTYAPGTSAGGGLSRPAAAAAPDGGLHRKLVWLTLFRIATITVLLGGTAAVNWQFGPRATAVVAPLYAVVAVTYAASLAFAVLLRAGRLELAVAVAQLVLDVGIATAVVATTGLSDSVFVFMYLLAIVNGSIVLHRTGAVGGLALALAAYGALVLLRHPDPQAIRATLFAHGSAFVATAALAGYLAEQLRRTGERLAESEGDLAAITALHASIVQSVTSGLLTLDRQGRITFLNRAGEQITGLASADVVGQPGVRWFPAFAARSGREEIPFVDARGAWRLLGYTAFPLRVRDEAQAGTAVIFQDLTELREMEEAVQRAKRLADLGELAAGLAHEVRNPLASISGCVELLRGAEGLSEEDARVLEIVLRETARLDALLTRFLEFSRPTPPARRSVDLAAVAGETLDMFSADPGAAGLALERDLRPTPVVVDPDQLRQVVLNLLSNAAQALRDSGKGGRIRVTCEPAGDGGAVVSVEDDGPGVPPDVAGHMFTPFFTTKPRGTGLGLAVVQRIVDAHGGSVSVQSSPGAGARFTVRVPPAAPPPAAGSNPERPMASILVVDDEASMREFLQILLAKQGHRVAAAADVAGALRRVDEGGLDLVITDLRLGSESGVDVLRTVKERSPATEVVMVTAFATTENAVQAMKLGAYDYVLKPFKVDELGLVVQKALERRALVQENRVLRHRVERPRLGPTEILGRSAAIEEVRALVEKVGPTRTTVLVAGESGTGKEVVARAIHDRGERRDQPFVAINCGAIPEGLIESELFGHEKGSFTGATDAKAGLFEVAGSGTLFLDEVAELPPQLQVKLLRALQERRIRRVGGKADIAVDARIIAATNRDLQEEVAAGRFREDLFYRLNVIQLRMPPLRARREDIPAFLAHFLARFAVEVGKGEMRFSPAAEQRLCEYDYPGNVRELANIVERAVTLADGPEIGMADLPPALRSSGGAPAEAGPNGAELPEDGMDLQAHLDRVERRLLEQALSRTRGVKTDAARLLSLTFRSLRYRLAKYGIDR